MRQRRGGSRTVRPQTLIDMTGGPGMSIMDDESLTRRRRRRAGDWLRPVLAGSVLFASAGLSLSQGIAARAADVSVIVRGGTCTTAAAVDAAISGAGGEV